VLLLAKGQLVAQGPTEATLSAAALSSLYGRPIEVATVHTAGGAARRVCIPAG
jgi:ABC-type hemin transport system ATPase subunit